MEKLEESRNEYSWPIKVFETTQVYKPRYSPEHTGEFAPAVDIVVPDPRIKVTEILAPCDGVVVAGILDNDRWGKTEEFKNYLNWIHIKTSNDEFYEIAHISPIANRILRVGDKVDRGKVIAVAGLNGRMTVTKQEDGQEIVDSHVHLFVGKYLKKGFKGLKIKWQSFEVK